MLSPKLYGFSSILVWNKVKILTIFVWRGVMHLSLASSSGVPWAICGGIGDFVRTLQQIWTAVVEENYVGI